MMMRPSLSASLASTGVYSPQVRESRFVSTVPVYSCSR
jgi:hypothetical protein